LAPGEQFRLRGRDQRVGDRAQGSWSRVRGAGLQDEPAGAINFSKPGREGGSLVLFTCSFIDRYFESLTLCPSEHWVADKPRPSALRVRICDSQITLRC